MNYVYNYCVFFSTHFSQISIEFLSIYRERELDTQLVLNKIKKKRREN